MIARARWSSGFTRRTSVASALAALLLPACSSESNNQAPLATAQEVAAAQDVALDVLLAGTDPDGDALSFSISSPPAHGALSGTAPAVTYAPEPGYSGSDAFTFTVSDGEVTSAATVSLTVVPAAGPPVAGGAALDAALARVVWQNAMHGGLAVAVAKDGVLLFSRGYGLGDRAAGATFEPDALGRVASCSKQLTAVTVMRLVEQGLLSLDDRLFDVLTELPLPSDADPRLSRITIRHLLAHTAGFDHPMEDPLIDGQRRLAALAGVPSPPTCADVFGQFRYVDLGYEPGTRWAYSNLGYCALSLVVEHVTGRAYQQVVRTDVLSPMGIHDARFGGTRLADRAPGEVAYESGSLTGISVFPEDGGARVPWAYGAASIPTLAGAAAWIASAVDLTRFVDAVHGRGGAPGFLTPGSLAAMETPGSLVSDRLFSGWTYRYGLGAFVVDDEAGTGERWWGHPGSLWGSGCHMWANADGWSWAAVWNETRDPLPGAIWQAVVAAIDPAFTGSPTDLYASFPSPELGPYLGR